MVHSKLPLLALASTALAGVVQREEPEVEGLNPGESHFSSAPAWAASTPAPTEKGSSDSVPFTDELSNRPQGPHSTFFPSAPSIHFPLPTDGPPPFVTPLPGKGEFAHTGHFVRPTAIPQEYNDPEPPHSIPPQGFSDPVQTKPSEIHTPPPAFSSEGSVPLYSSSAQPPIPSAHPEPSQALSSQPQPPFSSSARPSESSGGIHPLEPSGHPERPPWFYGLPPPFDLFPGEPEKSHEEIPPPQPSGAIPGEPPKPQGGSPDESHGLPPPPPPDYEHDPLPVAGAHSTEPAVNVGGPSPHYGVLPPVSCPYSTPGEHPSGPGPHPIPDEKPNPHSEYHLPSPVVKPTGYDKGGHEQVPPPPHGAPGSEQPSPAQPAEYPAHPSQPGPAVTEPATNPEAELPASTSTTCTYSQSESHAIPAASATQSQPTKDNHPHHNYGSQPSNPPTPSNSLVKKPSSLQSTPEPSKTDVPGAEPSDIRFSSLAPGSFKTSIPVGVLVGALGALVFSLTL